MLGSHTAKKLLVLAGRFFLLWLDMVEGETKQQLYRHARKHGKIHEFGSRAMPDLENSNLCLRQLVHENALFCCNYEHLRIVKIRQIPAKHSLGSQFPGIQNRKNVLGRGCAPPSAHPLTHVLRKNLIDLTIGQDT